MFAPMRFGTCYTGLHPLPPVILNYLSYQCGTLMWYSMLLVLVSVSVLLPPSMCLNDI